jgi:hypothetical protein
MSAEASASTPSLEAGKEHIENEDPEEHYTVSTEDNLSSKGGEVEKWEDQETSVSSCDPQQQEEEEDDENQYVDGDYGYYGEHDAAEDREGAGFVMDYGYEEAAPQRRQLPGRRNSLIGHIMAWAGAINQEHFESDHHPASGVAPGNSSSSSRRGVDISRRASMDDAGPVRVPAVGETNLRLCASSDEMDLFGGEDHPSEGEDDHRPPEPRAPRRNSLHAMVERAMAYVNLRPDPNADDLCPFGTRRDSLF